MKTAIIGASGQLGKDVAAAFLAAADEVTCFGHDTIEVASLHSTREALSSIQPDVVVNAAAFHHVEKCEADPQQAFAINGMGARNVAQVSDLLHAKLIHISTDYVFDGRRRTPYVEESAPAPLNVYGNTKLAGEFFVRSLNSRHFVVRISAIYGSHPCRAKGGLNFVELMLKLARERDEIRVVDDEFVSPTPTVEIAQQLVSLSRTCEYGLYHATAEGNCSWYEFARTIFDLTDTKIRLEPARPGEFPAKVPRPKYSVLENQALKRKSLNVFNSWQEGLRNYLNSRIQQSHSVPA